MSVGQRFKILKFMNMLQNLWIINLHNSYYNWTSMFFFFNKLNYGSTTVILLCNIFAKKNILLNTEGKN